MFPISKAIPLIFSVILGSDYFFCNFRGADPMESYPFWRKYPHYTVNMIKRGWAEENSTLLVGGGAETNPTTLVGGRQSRLVAKMLFSFHIYFYNCRQTINFPQGYIYVPCMQLCPQCLMWRFCLK